MEEGIFIHPQILPQSLFSGTKSPPDHRHGLLLQHPFQQVINILKMIIKRLSVDIARLDQLTHCDFGKRLPPHQLF